MAIDIKNGTGREVRERIIKAFNDLDTSFLKRDNRSLVCEYAHSISGELPDGDYSSSDFWLSVKPGIYYAVREKGRNKPTDYGLVEVVSNGEVSVTWNYFGKVWKWYQDYGKANSGWKEVLTGRSTSQSISNTVVSRDANGDFESRWITASHFLTKAVAQDNIFNKNSEICFRMPQASESSPSHMRFVTLAKFKEIIYGTDFISIKNLNGFTNLPNGLMIQWGTALVASGDNTVPTLFPIAFPNRCLNITATHIGGAKSVNVIVFDGSVTQTGAVFKHSWTGGVSTNVSYLAIGY